MLALFGLILAFSLCFYGARAVKRYSIRVHKKITIGCALGAVLMGLGMFLATTTATIGFGERDLYPVGIGAVLALFSFGMLIKQMNQCVDRTLFSSDPEREKRKAELKRQLKQELGWFTKKQSNKKKPNKKYSHQTPTDCKPQRISFYYTDSKGNSSHRDVSVVSYGANHFCGHCHTRDEMRTFRFDRLKGIAVLYDTGEEIPHNKLRRYLSMGFNNDLVQLANITQNHNQLEVSALGFDAKTREHLCELAADFNVKVRKSLAQNVVFLCAGYTVTAAQLREARQRDLPVISAHAFYRLVTMGEISEDEEPHEYFSKQLMVNS